MKFDFDNSETQEELNIWMAFTDLMSNSFMILSLFLSVLLISLVLVQINEEKLKTENAKLKQIINENEDLKQKLIALSSPPLWVYRDSDQDVRGRSLRFEVGEADIPPALREKIVNDVVGDIKRKLENNPKIYDGYIIQVIGHTDGQKVGQGFSNLDDGLEQVAVNKKSLNSLRGGSNVDLGLMRAIAVVKLLEKELPSWQNFRAYSAGQLYLSSGEYAPIQRQNNPARRRIEISLVPPPVNQ